MCIFVLKSMVSVTFKWNSESIIKTFYHNTLVFDSNTR